MALNAAPATTLPLNASVVGTNSYATISSSDLVLAPDCTGADEIVPPIKSKDVVLAPDAAISRLVVCQSIADIDLTGKENASLIVGVEGRRSNLVKADHSKATICVIGGFGVLKGPLVKNFVYGNAASSNLCPSVRPDLVSISNIFALTVA